jgi:hypothetical protein
LHTLLDVLTNGQIELFGRDKITTTGKRFLSMVLSCFAVSSTMMPSDQTGTPGFRLGCGRWFCSLAIFTGAGAWMLQNIAPLLNDFLGSVTTLFGLNATLHIALLLPIILLHRVVSRVTGGIRIRATNEIDTIGN